MDKNDLTDEDIESLRIVANSDLRSAKYASKLCESFNIDTSPEPGEPIETTENPTEPTESEPSGSIFAYWLSVSSLINSGFSSKSALNWSNAVSSSPSASPLSW